MFESDGRVEGERHRRFLWIISYKCISIHNYRKIKSTKDNKNTWLLEITQNRTNCYLWLLHSYLGKKKDEGTRGTQQELTAERSQHPAMYGKHLTSFHRTQMWPRCDCRTGDTVQQQSTQCPAWHWVKDRERWQQREEKRNRC